MMLTTLTSLSSSSSSSSSSSITTSNITFDWVLSIHTRGSSSPTCHFFGFFIEFLGLSSALQLQIPNSRLVYANCTDDFHSSLFPKESNSLRYLQNYNNNNHNNNHNNDNNHIKTHQNNTNTIRAVVYHGTTCDAFPKNRKKDEDSNQVLHIGRYMLEKDDNHLAKKRSPQKRGILLLSL